MAGQDSFPAGRSGARCASRSGWALSAAALLLLSLSSLPASALMARKPSFYEQGFGNAMDSAANRRAPNELPVLTSEQDFQRLARVYSDPTQAKETTSPRLPHVLFVIDRASKPAQLIFINTPRYQLHERFLRDTQRTQADRAGFNRNYLAPDRRFILGTLAWQPMLKSYTYEFWEGDRLTPALLQATQQQLTQGFFAPVRFKANSSAQEAAGVEARLPVVTQSQLLDAKTYLPLNLGHAIGRLRLLDKLDNVPDLAREDIVLLRQLPLSLPPVAGVISESASTLLSHVNLLTKGWGVPNAYVQNATTQLAALNGQWVSYEVARDGYTLRAASPAELAAYQQNRQARAAQTSSAPAQPAVRLDLQRSALAPLAHLRKADSRYCGAKAANLGEVQAAKIAGVQVPDGFCIPFAAYAQFMREQQLPQRLAQLQQRPGFATDAVARRKWLAAFQAEIEQWPLSEALTQSWLRQWSQQLSAAGVFVRSSSSSEDLPHFSGAGLYSTVPNVRTAEALASAVRKVWASVYNFEAWEARRAAGIEESQVVMAVLVQTAVDSEASGVLVTRNPFDSKQRHTSFIAAKRGLGIRVVEGQRVAEQVLYSSRSKAVQVLTHSDDDTALQLDATGGVREVPVTAGRAVLSDARVQRLAKVGDAIEQRFGGKAQDIEWAIAGDRIIVLQARPFVDNSPR